MSKPIIKAQSALFVQLAGILITLLVTMLTWYPEHITDQRAFTSRVDRAMLTADLRMMQVFMMIAENQAGQPGAIGWCDAAEKIRKAMPYVVALVHQRGTVDTSSGIAACRDASRAGPPGQPHFWINPSTSKRGLIKAASGELVAKIDALAEMQPPRTIATLALADRKAGRLIALLTPHRPGSAASPGYFSVIIDPAALFIALPATGHQALPLTASVLSARPGPAVVAANRSGCLIDCPPVSTVRTLSLGGEQWPVQVSAAAPPVVQRYRGTVSVAMLGLILSILWSLHVRRAQSASWQVATMIERRERELQALNEILMDDIHHRKQVMDELSRSRAQLRQLADHHAHLKEEDRKRIAREIHDDLGQSMMVLRIDLSLIAQSNLSPTAHARVQQALAQIDQTMTAMRLIINELRPAVLDLGLDVAIEWEAKKFSRRSNITCTLDLQIGGVEISDRLTTAFYRIAQESLTNIMRHSQARSTTIFLRVDQEWLFMTIADDGVGMQENCQRSSESFGLIGIAERVFALGGAFSTESTAGNGTKLLIAAPLVQPC